MYLARDLAAGTSRCPACPWQLHSSVTALTGDHLSGPEHRRALEGGGEIARYLAGAGPTPKMKRKEYERQMRILHGELVAMQEWVKESGAAWPGQKSRQGCPIGCSEGLGATAKVGA
jgi:hypothetical protein